MSVTIFPFSQKVNLLYKLIQILEMPVDRGEAYVRHLVDNAQLFQNQVADDLAVNLAAAFA